MQYCSSLLRLQSVAIPCLEIYFIPSFEIYFIKKNAENIFIYYQNTWGLDTDQDLARARSCKSCEYPKVTHGSCRRKRGEKSKSF